ncbi:DedA family protein [Azospirillum halopraeferens]|uniref:DedA family protein n=1 Tax=Azospirillum halopraeferens TaxID=34010 RepID=UPI0006841E02|nr:DedA family protein [Azospirillum halopraeferens]
MTEWLVQVLHSMHYVGIFLLLVLARVIPPIPAESVIPLAGLAAAKGDYSLMGIALAGGLGSLAGQFVWYAPARFASRERLHGFLERHGHWLTIRPDKVQQATRWFERHGGIAVFFCQPIPGLRTLISIPAGACRMPVWHYALASAAGSVLWTLVLAWAGYTLATWPAAVDWVAYATAALVVGLVGAYVVRLVRFFCSRGRARQGTGGGAAALQPIAAATMPVNPVVSAHSPKPPSASPVQ